MHMYCLKCGTQNEETANFCKKCGNNTLNIAKDQERSPGTPTDSNHTQTIKPPRNIIFYFIAPILSIIGVTLIWGLSQFIFEPSAPILSLINEVLVPFVIGLAFLAIPIGVIYGLYKQSKYYDGTIKCGNCGYVGIGKRGRSTWARVTVWILFFLAPLITVIYYLSTHRYICPKCNSTFVGLRDVNGNFSSGKGNLGPLGIVLVVLLIIAIVGIIAAVVLASLNEAREAGVEASEKASGSIQKEKLELTEDFSILLQDDITSRNIVVNGVAIGDPVSKIPNSIITGQDAFGIQAGMVTYQERDMYVNEKTQKIVDSISLYSKEIQDLFPNEKSILSSLGPAEDVYENTSIDGMDFKSYAYTSRGISIVVYEHDNGPLVRVILNEPR